jgi:hypothetical protein
MRFLLSLVPAVLLFSSTAAAQRTTGYWYLAPGAVTAAGHSSATLDMGGGAEFSIWKDIAAGVEGGAVANTRNYTGTVQGEGSINGYYHFLRTHGSRLDPFATVGYSLFFRRGTSNLVNYGGGLNYWVWKTAAFRIEVRDHVYGNSPTLHYWGVRFGMSFTELSP